MTRRTTQFPTLEPLRVMHKRWSARAGKNKKTYTSVGFKSAEDAHDFVCLLRDMLHGSFANHKGVTN